MDRKVIVVNFNHANMADEATAQLDRDIVDALNGATDAGVATGIVVAILTARLHLEVAQMCAPVED